MAQKNWFLEELYGMCIMFMNNGSIEGGVLEMLPAIILILAGTACTTKRHIYHELNT
jgi:hypothetical protein